MLDISKAFDRVWHTVYLDRLASELDSDLQDIVDWGRKWLADFNAGKTQLFQFDCSCNTGAIDVKMDGSVLERKSSEVDFLFEIGLGLLQISIAKTVAKKNRALLRFMKFLSPEVSVSINLPHSQA